jgi:group I intron endonuclease
MKSLVMSGGAGKKFYLYLITNLKNEKVYIGKTTDPKERWRRHKLIAKNGKEKHHEDFSVIHAAIAKHGIDNFSFEIIDEFDDEEEAYAFETINILLACSNKKQFGYNCNIGGEGGIIPNEETRARLVAAQNRPEAIKRASERMKQRHIENPGHLSSVHKGNQYTKGMVLSDERKQKISEQMKGRIVSEETKLKISKSHTGEKHNRAKLKEKDVLEIRELFSKKNVGSKVFCETMSKKYGVGPKTIEQIVYRTSWRHI